MHVRPLLPFALVVASACATPAPEGSDTPDAPSQPTNTSSTTTPDTTPPDTGSATTTESAPPDTATDTTATSDTAPPPPVITPTAPRAGVDPLACTASGPVSWEHDGIVVSKEPEVSPWDVLPGTWTCTSGTQAASVVAEAESHNLLVVFIDDVGIDRLGSYGLASPVPPTPTLDRLADEGVRFTNVYATPLCSPSRAALLTGKLPSRTGFGGLVGVNDTEDRLAGHRTVAEVVADQGYDTSVTGKWHLAGQEEIFRTHPADHGFSWHRGTMNNPEVLTDLSRARGTYGSWQELDNGTLADREGYLTTATVDDAIERLDAMKPPWLLYVPVNAVHTPLHTPPDDLRGPLDPPYTSRADEFDAVLHALDTELGRLLDAVDDRGLTGSTNVVVMSDNGTQDFAIRPPYRASRSKGSVYEAGVRVPLWVTGPLVTTAGSTSSAMVHVTDLFATAQALSGAPDDGEVRDSVSFLPYLADPSLPSARERLYSEKFTPNGHVERRSWSATLKDDAHKLITRQGGEDLFFRLDTPDDYDEGEALDLAALDKADQEAYDRLKAEITDLQAGF